MTEYRIIVKYLNKEARWVALVEFPDGDAVVTESLTLGQTLSQAAERIGAAA